MDCLRDMMQRFAIPEGIITASSFGNGHINDTFLVTVEGVHEEYILQRLNDHVFTRPQDVMENIQSVTDYLARQIVLEGGDPARETMTLVRTHEGAHSALDAEGHLWRAFVRIPDTVSPELPDRLETLEECGRAFGCFSRRLSAYPAHTLHETIPAFHDTPARLEQLESAVRRNAAGRAGETIDELAFARRRREDTGILVRGLREGILPLRVTHNDTKVNNVLLDKHTGHAVCVVDLDTVMPGLLAYDFGDAVRVGACTAAEDERDLSRVHLDIAKYEAFARGFLRELRGALSREEVLSLAAGAHLMTLENGLRFLADYLNGDIYFKIHRPGQNLDRARAQFALAADMERQRAQMEVILLRYI